MSEVELNPALTETLKRTVVALERQGVPFVIGGGLAAWAHGGPVTSGDIDLMVCKADARKALEALVAAGMRAEDPPEQWLLKAWDGEILVDVIFEPAGLTVTEEVIDRGEVKSLVGMRVPVLSPEDLFVTKLMSVDEHALDYERMLQMARALREKVDWGKVREQTSASPYARGFLALAEELRIVRGTETRTPTCAVRVRALGDARPVPAPGSDAGSTVGRRSK